MVQLLPRAGIPCTRRALALAAFCLIGLGPAAGRAAPLDEAAERYRPYMIEQIDQSLAGARALRERLSANDVEGAKREWIAARVAQDTK